MSTHASPDESPSARTNMKPSRKPHPKVAAGGAAGALSIILVFVLGEAGVSIPPEVASALTVLLSAAAGYMKRAA